MNYRRVIPRDLFNEADLLKCLGKLWLLTEGRPAVEFNHLDDDGPFEVFQDESDGSIYLNNVTVRVKGGLCHLYRPLNSREAWPLWIRDLKGETFDFEVFDTEQEETAGVCLSEEMLTLMGIYDED